MRSLPSGATLDSQTWVQENIGLMSYNKNHAKVWIKGSKSRSVAKTKSRSFRFRNGSKVGVTPTSHFTLGDITDKFGTDPRCYLTGRKISWEDTSSWSFDHMTPATRGGSNELNNLGIACRQANQCKADLTPEEFVNLCLEIVKNHGYIVIKKDNTKFF